MTLYCIQLKWIKQEFLKDGFSSSLPAFKGKGHFCFTVGWKIEFIFRYHFLNQVLQSEARKDCGLLQASLQPTCSKKEKTSCSIHSSFQTHTIRCLYIPHSVPSYCSVAITLHLSFLLTHHLPISFTFSFDSLCSILIPFSVLLPPCSWCGRGSSGEGGGLLLETALNNTFLLERSRGGWHGWRRDYRAGYRVMIACEYNM